MKIFIHEITDLDTELHFSQEDPWVLEAVRRVDEQADEEDFAPRPAGLPVKTKAERPRPVRVDFNLHKVDEVVVVSGKIEAAVQLLCSRCAQRFDHACEPSFSALFCKDPVMAGVAHLQKEEKEDRSGRASATWRPVGQNHGYARHAHDFESDGPHQDSSRNIDITYISNDFVDLSDVLTEQLQLQIPFQPLCRTDCKGICSQCGTDLNTGRCACAKITSSRPFSVLKDLKLSD